MAATIHVIATFRSKAGKEEALKAVLIALVPPARRELGCYQYDLLQSSGDSQAFALVERWDSDKALDRHLETDHVKKAVDDWADLIEVPLQVTRYSLV